MTPLCSILHEISLTCFIDSRYSNIALQIGSLDFPLEPVKTASRLAYYSYKFFWTIFPSFCKKTFRIAVGTLPFRRVRRRFVSYPRRQTELLNFHCITVGNSAGDGTLCSWRPHPGPLIPRPRARLHRLRHAYVLQPAGTTRFIQGTTGYRTLYRSVPATVRYYTRCWSAHIPWACWISSHVENPPDHCHMFIIFDKIIHGSSESGHSL